MWSAPDNNDEIDKENDKGLDQVVEELLKLAGDIDLEGDLMADGEGEDDNEKGWIDEWLRMSWESY